MNDCQLTIVIPARDEADRLGGCLDALLAQDGDEAVRIVVVANGCRDNTAQLARDRADALRERGHQIVVLDLAQAGKPAALNAGDRHADGCRIYLDADAALAPDAVAVMHRALHADGAAPRLVSPRPRFTLAEPRPRLGSGSRSGKPGSAAGAGRLAAGYFAVWSQLPAVRGQVIGGGCYAVNAAGRQRWRDFPPLVADDAFVRGQFAPAERQLVESEFVTAFPDRERLVRVVRRWRAGNRELALSGHGKPGAGVLRNLALVARRPSLWRHIPAFIYVLTLTRAPSGQDDRSPAWTR